MRKAEFRMLEKVFAAEVENRLPFQTRSKIVERLKQAGFVQTLTIRVGTPPLHTTVKGWQLTHLGRITYCMACEKP